MTCIIKRLLIFLHACFLGVILEMYPIPTSGIVIVAYSCALSKSNRKLLTYMYKSCTEMGGWLLVIVGQILRLWIFLLQTYHIHIQPMSHSSVIVFIWILKVSGHWFENSKIGLSQRTNARRYLKLSSLLMPCDRDSWRTMIHCTPQFWNVRNHTI